MGEGCRDHEKPDRVMTMQSPKFAQESSSGDHMTDMSLICPWSVLEVSLTSPGRALDVARTCP